MYHMCKYLIYNTSEVRVRVLVVQRNERTRSTDDGLRDQGHH